MEQKSMTALVSAFSRAYHSLNNDQPILNDSVAGRLFTKQEYEKISEAMSSGIVFFNPAFTGDSKQALRWIVDHQLSPSPLGRTAFAEKSLERAVQIGARQYLIWGAGYDTFAYRQPPWANVLQIFEIDHFATAADKQERLKNAGIVPPDNVHFLQADFTKQGWQAALLEEKSFNSRKISFSTMLGVVYYLSKQTFEDMIAAIGKILPKGSSVLFDYPGENNDLAQADERAKKQAMLAEGAKEKMLASYSYSDMERLLSAHDFLIYEHLNPQEMTEQYFEAYNNANPAHPIKAFAHVNYCLAVKK